MILRSASIKIKPLVKTKTKIETKATMNCKKSHVNIAFIVLLLTIEGEDAFSDQRVCLKSPQKKHLSSPICHYVNAKHMNFSHLNFFAQLLIEFLISMHNSY